MNPFVHELTLKGHNNDIVLFNLLLNIFPNLNTLHLEYMTEFNCANLVQLERLEHLIVDHFKIECLMNVKLPKLKSLRIGYLYPFTFEDWENITASNPNIGRLEIAEVSHFTTMHTIKNAIDIMVKSLNLNYFRLIQNNATSDCLKITVDKSIVLSVYASKMLRKTIEYLQSKNAYRTIKILY